MEIFFFILLFFGLSGLFLFRTNVIVLLMGIELMLLSINLLFAYASFYLDDVIGQTFFLFLLTIAAAEVAVGLAILVIFYRLRGVIVVDVISELKG